METNITSSFIDSKPTGQLKSCLIFDLETTGLDINECEILTFHAYSYSTKKYYNFIFKGNEEKIKKILLAHNLYCTYNGDNFDIPILNRIYNWNFSSTKNLDLLKVVKKRGTLIKYGGFKSHSLYNISRVLNLKYLKTKFDFEKKINLNNLNELHDLMVYGKQDINVTKSLLEYLLKYFEFYKTYLPQKDIISWSWLMSSPGTYAYKAICHLSGIEEKWLSYEEREKFSDKKIKFKGGYVSVPSKEIAIGNIYCLDFNSAYPHAYMMMNLFGYNCKCCSDNEKYSGCGQFSLVGKYCSKKLSPISKTIKKLYALRLKYKANKDPREVALKIILNTLYGIGGNRNFVNVFNINTVSDCTKFVRESVKLARNIFNKSGYDVIYSDTDSVYLRDTFNNEAKLMAEKNKIITQIKNSVPFPVKTFDMGIDDKIKLMYFPKKKKKNYLYVTRDNKIKFKGLPIMKDNSTRLSMFIFNKYLKKYILNGTVKIPAKKLRSFIFNELKKDITKAGISFKTKKYSDYHSKSSIYAQISKKYGAGENILIPNNKKIGIGKSKSYCTVKDFIASGLNIKDINLDKVFSELQIFSLTTLVGDFVDVELKKWII